MGNYEKKAGFDREITVNSVLAPPYPPVHLDQAPSCLLKQGSQGLPQHVLTKHEL